MSDRKPANHFAAPEAAAQPAQLREAYQRYWGELCGYLLNKFGPGPPEPEDVAQTAFTKLAENSHSVKNPRAFLYATARNEVIEYHRRATRRRPYDLDIAEQSAAEKLSEFDAERVFMGKEQLDILLQALERLPVRQRRVFLLSRVDGLTCEAIARREGMSSAAVQKQIERAVAKCLDALDAANRTGSES